MIIGYVFKLLMKYTQKATFIFCIRTPDYNGIAGCVTHLYCLLINGLLPLPGFERTVTDFNCTIFKG